ncbi:aminoglycoside phosphotransferase [Miniimonas arenae]|uniref:Aminoglycoside phosphotransferase n=1 Tax=Miniimonas arenae TaxID=676201 RepID=A0A5C5BBB8_9MICO|nr:MULTISPECIES: phosphotransferase [Miniimonas]TNU74813.1 aminoglycoside phosphotransferase [Miniimonas arenae]
MLPRRAQLARARAVATSALREYPMPPGRLTFLTHGENTTFRLDCDDGRFLVRVHRPLRHGRSLDPHVAIGSELTWLRAIASGADVGVPEPIETRDGSLTATGAGGDWTRVCSVLRWVEGRIIEDFTHPVHFARLGRAMATLHHQADTWTPLPGFARLTWDHEAFFGDVMVYGTLRASECWELLPRALAERFDAVRDRLGPVMANDADVGLIHADLHLGNVVHHDRTISLIDFDDSGTGPRVYDLAVALWERRDEPEYPMLRDALLTAYRKVRPIDTTHLDDYIAARQVAFDLWYTGTAQVDPAFADRLDVVHRWSADMLDLLEAAPPSLVTTP